jgi:hypothetical protein
MRRLDEKVQMLKDEIQDLKSDLDIAKDRILQLQTALEGKAALVHAHSIGQVTNLQNILNTVQTRLTALEAHFP